MAIYHMAMILKIEIMVVSVLYSLHNEIIHMHVYPVGEKMELEIYF